MEQRLSEVLKIMQLAEQSFLPHRFVLWTKRTLKDVRLYHHKIDGICKTMPK